MKTRKAGLALALALALLLTLTACGTQGMPTPDPVPANTYSAEDFVVAGGFLTYDGDGPSYVGVDVSAHQGEIDWERVADAGVDFAMIRAGYRGYTEGGIFQDEYFVQNMEGAIAAGLEVGVYFFSQAVDEEEAVEEARQVLEWITPYDVAWPVVFDWERVSQENSRTLDTSGDAITNATIAFCREVVEAGYLPMVYFSPSKGYTELELERLLDWPFWLAHYTEDWSATSFRYHFAMWQYTSSGTVDGISTNVDLNLCLTDFEEWRTDPEGEGSVPPERENSASPERENSSRPDPSPEASR